MTRANKKISKAVILAGGKGIRLYPLTEKTPKPLLLINKKPMINYLVDLFTFYGIEDFAILINKKFKKDFEDWRRAYYPKNKIKIFEEKKPLGTFGGFCLIKRWIGKSQFFVTNGDDLTRANLYKIAQFHQRHSVPATIVLAKVPNPGEYGVVISLKSKVKEFIEKPKNPLSNYVNSGLYLFNPEILSYHPGPKFSMIEKDLFPLLAKEGKLASFKYRGRWLDCGTFERYKKAIKGWGNS